jgi:hypothetical protein
MLASSHPSENRLQGSNEEGAGEAINISVEMGRRMKMMVGHILFSAAFVGIQILVSSAVLRSTAFYGIPFLAASIWETVWTMKTSRTNSQVRMPRWVMPVSWLSTLTSILSIIIYFIWHITNIQLLRYLIGALILTGTLLLIILFCRRYNADQDSEDSLFENTELGMEAFTVILKIQLAAIVFSHSVEDGRLSSVKPSGAFGVPLFIATSGAIFLASINCHAYSSKKYKSSRASRILFAIWGFMWPANLAVIYICTLSPASLTPIAYRSIPLLLVEIGFQFFLLTLHLLLHRTVFGAAVRGRVGPSSSEILSAPISEPRGISIRGLGSNTAGGDTERAALPPRRRTDGLMAKPHAKQDAKKALISTDRVPNNGTTADALTIQGVNIPPKKSTSQASTYGSGALRQNSTDPHQSIVVDNVTPNPSQSLTQVAPTVNASQIPPLRTGFSFAEYARQSTRRIEASQQREQQQSTQANNNQQLENRQTQNSRPSIVQPVVNKSNVEVIPNKNEDDSSDEESINFVTKQNSERFIPLNQDDLKNMLTYKPVAKPRLDNSPHSITISGQKDKEQPADQSEGSVNEKPDGPPSPPTLAHESPKIKSPKVVKLRWQTEEQKIESKK